MSDYQEYPPDVNGVSYAEDKTIGHWEYWQAVLRAAIEEENRATECLKSS